MTKEKHQTYSQHEYYESFKQIRNKLRTFSLVGIIQRGVEYLHSPTKDEMAYLQKQPWVVLLLLKWAIIDDNALLKGRPLPTTNQTHKLLQATLDLGDKVRMPDQYEHYNLFFRALAYQQFIFQNKSSPVEIGRQFFYFGDLPRDHYIATTFRELSGVDIGRFLELSLVLFVRFFEKKETSISPAWFSSLSDEYSKHEIDSFLRSLSLPLTEMRSMLLAREAVAVERNENPRSASEYYEQSPFLNFPLIKTAEDIYTCVEHNLMFRCIERYIYNRVRAKDAAKFMISFGPVFERYVEKAVEYMDLTFVNEKTIATGIENRHGVKLVDFIITEGDANIFIDAKAVEMSYQGKIAHQSGELLRWIQSSVFKAIEQGNSVLAALPDFPVGFPITPQPRNYLIAVTYSELYVGSGRNLMETLGAEAEKVTAARVVGSSAIPFENMYFLTIQEFEALAHAVHTKQTTLTRVLDAVTVADADPRTRKFDLYQHLSALGVESHATSYLKERTFFEIDRMAQRLRKGQTIV